MNSLTISNLFKSYQNHEVLRGVSLLVPDASLTAVLGASGSGKTTLLRIVAGFERAGGGEVKIGDRWVETGSVHIAAERRGVGYVSQDGALFPHLSVHDNVAFGLPRPERRSSRVDELLELVGLSNLGRRFPHQLSGGEQQRVSLARALAPRPRLIVMDEPFSALDAGLRASLRSDVRAVLRETGVTAILVTHDQDEALSLADQVAVLRDGRIIQNGTPKQIYEFPADRELAQFIGHANFIDGVIEKGKALTALGPLPLSHPAATGQNGARVTVLVRPEQIKTALSAPSKGLEAVVESTGYFGADAVLTVRPAISDTGPLVVRVPGYRAVPIGTKVWLTFEGEATAF